MPDSVHLCDCRDLKVGEVRDAIKIHNLTTLEEVEKVTEAGCCCKSCVSPEEEPGRAVYIVDLLKEVNG